MHIFAGLGSISFIRTAIQYIPMSMRVFFVRKNRSNGSHSHRFLGLMVVTPSVGSSCIWCFTCNFQSRPQDTILAVLLTCLRAGFAAAGPPVWMSLAASKWFVRIKLDEYDKVDNVAMFKAPLYVTQVKLLAGRLDIASTMLPCLKKDSHF